jgi:hypothetical protein
MHWTRDCASVSFEHHWSAPVMLTVKLLMCKTVLAILPCVAGAGLVAVVTIAVFLPGPSRPSVLIKVVGHTNTAAGVQLSMISVRNQGPTRIFVYVPSVEVAAATEPGGLASYGKSGNWYSMIEPAGAGELAVAVPTNGTPWRLSCLVYNDFGVAQSIRRLLKGRRMPFDIRSGWIYADK